MSKKRLTDLAKDYNLSFDQILEIVSNNLEESSLTGKGKNTWVDKRGQEIIDDNVPIEDAKPKVYRGRVRNKCPNPRFIMVHIKEKMSVVKTQVPKKFMSVDWTNRIVTVKEEIENELYSLLVPKVY